MCTLLGVLTLVLRYVLFSAGCGRTGSFIAFDIFRHLLESKVFFYYIRRFTSLIANSTIIKTNSRGRTNI